MRVFAILFLALILPAHAVAGPDEGARPAISKRVTQLPGPPATLSFAPDKDDSVAAKCDELADAPVDPLRVGNGVEFGHIDASAALPACGQAAARLPARPRYQYLYGVVLVSARRYGEALGQFTRADHAGYALGAYGLGGLYADGLGVPQDPDKAASLFMRAGDGGIVDAFADLGGLYEEGASPDYNDATYWYWRAMNAGSDRGRVYLGECAANGLGVPKDPARAVKLFDEAARRGNSRGMFDLGVMYRDGSGVEKDPAAAVKWFNQAVTAGSLAAAAELGNAYYFGRGVAENHKTAFDWYLRAAKADIAVAERDAALMYDQGDGVAQSAADAVTWYRRAAGQGDAIAMTQLSHHLRRGRGVAANVPRTADVAESWRWLMKAAEAGFPQAETELGAFYQDGFGYRQAAHWFGEAASQGDGFAQIQLGNLYQNGLGVDRDPDQARRLFTQAAAGPDPEAAALARTSLAAMPAAPSPAPPIVMPQPDRPAADDDDSPPSARHLPPRPSLLASNRTDATAKAAIGVGLAIGAIMAIGYLAAPDSPNTAGPWCLPCTDGKGVRADGGMCLMGQPGCN
jgi:uncharacterized protein